MQSQQQINIQQFASKDNIGIINTLFACLKPEDKVKRAMHLDNHHESIFHFAAKTGNTAVVTIMLAMLKKHSPKNIYNAVTCFNDQNKSPLQLASEKGDGVMILTLLKELSVANRFLAVISSRCQKEELQGMTALHLAILNHHSESIALLLEALSPIARSKAVRYSLREDEASTPLHMAVRNGSPNEIMALLAPLKYQDKLLAVKQFDGVTDIKTPLELAVEANDIMSIQALLAPLKPEDKLKVVTQKNKWNNYKTPIDIAVENDQTMLFPSLILGASFIGREQLMQELIDKPKGAGCECMREAITSNAITNSVDLAVLFRCEGKKSQQLRKQFCTQLKNYVQLAVEVLIQQGNKIKRDDKKLLTAVTTSQKIQADITKKLRRMFANMPS